MTFTDFKQMQPTATAQAKSVLDYVELLCQVLRTNYQSFSIQMHRSAIENNGIVDETYIPWHEEEIRKLCEGEGVDKFVYEKGRKYAKILHITNPGGLKSVHMFIDMVTGDCYKPASSKAPAKGIRYNLLDDSSREEMLRRADWSGGYLYAR
ncbi:MAG: hypothetical protein EB127_06095 [Alphaproteobacteria bacterium]|nr:hypothetical protein [Alphaproteobacteria bacterium]